MRENHRWGEHEVALESPNHLGQKSWWRVCVWQVLSVIENTEATRNKKLNMYIT